MLAESAQIWAYIQAGGPTMYPLLLCGVWMWWLIFKQLEYSKRVELEQGKILEETMGQLRTGHRNTDTATLHSLIDTLQKKKRTTLSTVLFLGTVAPLLGLFGTITGMIDTFDAVTLFGLTNARAMAEGISAAMISTRTGLVIAIPGLLVAHFLRRSIVRRERKLEQAGLQILRLKKRCM